MDETPLPVYDELLRKTVVPSGFVPMVSANFQQSTGYSATIQPQLQSCAAQQLCGSYAPGARYMQHLRPAGSIPAFLLNYQPPVCGYPAVISNSSSMPVYTVASRQLIRMSTYPTANYQHQFTQNLPFAGAMPENVGQPQITTSTPRQNLATLRQQYQPPLNSNPMPLNSGHLAARQTVKDLPKFGGDPEDWPRFIAAYERTSRMCGLRNDELLDHRLERSLHDKALNAVKSLLLHPDNVPVIMSRLKTLFNRSTRIHLETMVRRIRMMPPPKAEKMETIVDFGVAVQNLCPTIQKPETRIEKKVWKDEVYVHAYSVHQQEKVDRKKCLACGNMCESLEKCSSFLKMSPNARWALVNEKKLCRKCLKKHFKTCEMKVPCNQGGCIFLHHRLLHDDSKHNKPSPSAPAQNASVNAHHSSLPNVLLKYVRVTLHGKGRSITTYAFLDAGSTTTLVEHSLRKELNLNGEKSPLCIAWTGGQGRYGQDSVIFSAEISSASKSGQRFHLPEVHTQNPEFCWELTAPDWSIHSIPGKEVLTPTAVLTRLGWVVYGPCSFLPGQKDAKNGVSYSYHICQCEGLHSAVKSYFSLDSLGVQLNGTPLMSKDDERAIKLLRENTVLHNKRYETCLLWRYDDVRLPSSKTMALKRQNFLSKRMAREPVLAKALQEKILDYQAKGYIRKLSAQEEATYSRRSWYLLIFPVVNPNKPNKLRIVWDAAAKVGNLSLNSFLLKGPDQVTPLQQVLQRFREYRTAVSGDIREMFNQVRINPTDQHCQRFLWDDGVLGGGPSTYVMEVMTFGASCSPSSAQFVKNLNAARFKDQYPEAVAAICKGTYVDDMFDSVESEA
ncbi:uncharacterized protein LOC134206886 [Armigeres subalbatus]|uniref:uncharacterized protein LOC134206886 n=1 Tax=Armigeres subalbatus TaxID=124917 RepID=UPI002ED559DE